MKIVIILVAAKREVSMSMSEGGSRNALTPIKTTRLKMEIISMIGAYTIMDIF